MCGIFVSICDHSFRLGDLSDKLQAANAKRGPSGNSLYRTSVEYPSLTISLEFFASELQLRGSIPIIQPHQQNGNVLCWNGEIFEGIDITSEDNDGVELFRRLQLFDTPDKICELFGTIEGPYAFVYYHSASRRLFFGRDPLGRRSLLVHKYTYSSPYFLLASVSAGFDPGYEFEELNTDYIYCIPFSSFDVNDMPGAFNAGVISFDRSCGLKGDLRLPYAKPSQVNLDLPPGESPQVESIDRIPGYLTDAVAALIYHLDRSVKLRVHDIPKVPDTNGKPRVAILFSGGIDSTILAYFANKHVPLDEPIDLLNVAFENPRKIQLQAEGNLGGLSKTKRKERERRGEKNVIQTSYMVPDRITGLQELEELRECCPERVWNFVEVNVPYQESQASRSIIESLMLPGRTVMDMSLALALYFASKGVGWMRNSLVSDPVSYTSTARVLLNGLGSDELLGGYGRHRSAFHTGGWQAVVDELQLEIDRISTRNLGRDDRVISSHGKETRHPFLSLAVVEFLSSLPVHFKMDPRLEIGLGDKMLLRLAASKLGLVEAGRRKKRAMQFGSHSARMDGERRGDTVLQP